jgi:hypothetical protein
MARTQELRAESKLHKTQIMTFEELKNLPTDSYILVEYKDKKFKYYVKDLTPELWEFLSDVATAITQN